MTFSARTAPNSIRSITTNAIPTLLLSGSFDVQTGAQWTSYAARTLSRATVVTIPGKAHRAFASPATDAWSRPSTTRHQRPIPAALPPRNRPIQGRTDAALTVIAP
jgi:TAP-like protein